MDTASLAYNVAMVNRLTNIQKDYISVCCTIEQVARLRWSLECKHHIEECEMELRKHKVMTAIDFTGLVVSGTVDVEEIKYQSIPSLSCMLKQLHLYN